MPNKISDDRRRVVYLEEKENWEMMKKVAKREGVSPSTLVRIATAQLVEKLKANPNTRFIVPIFQ